jgi:putative ABC transport system permease protein
VWILLELYGGDKVSAVSFFARKEIEKNKRTFIFIAIAIAISTANIVIINGSIDGVFNDLIERTLKISSGDVNIYPNEQDKYIDGLGIKELKLETLEGVVASSPRITAGGTLFYKEKFKSIKILALDPQKENRVTILLSKIDSGETLASNDRNGILIPYRLADELKVRVGDEAKIVFENGNTRVFKIKGIQRTGLAMDTNTVIVNFYTASEQLNLNNKASVILVKLSDKSLADRYKPILKQSLEAGSIKTWGQEIESIVSSAEIEKEIGAAIIAIGLFAATVSIGVMLYINIISKRRQIGIMKAIGMKDSQLLLIYVLEALFLGAIGVLVGNILGYASIKYLEAHPFSDPVFGSLSPRFYTYLLYDASVETLLTVILASAYPALIAGKMNIIKAIWGY